MQWAGRVPFPGKRSLSAQHSEQGARECCTSYPAEAARSVQAGSSCWGTPGTGAPSVSTAASSSLLTATYPPPPRPWRVRGPMDITTILSHLQAVTGPDGEGRYLARCPQHDDRTPSLRVFADGGALCFGPCDRSWTPAQFAALLGVAPTLRPQRSQGERGASPKPGHPSLRWPPGGRNYGQHPFGPWSGPPGGVA